MEEMMKMNIEINGFEDVLDFIKTISELASGFSNGMGVEKINAAPVEKKTRPVKPAKNDKPVRDPQEPAETPDMAATTWSISIEDKPNAPMTREEKKAYRNGLKESLDQRGISYNPSAGTGILEKKLKDAIGQGKEEGPNEEKKEKDPPKETEKLTRDEVKNKLKLIMKTYGEKGRDIVKESIELIGKCDHIKDVDASKYPLLVECVEGRIEREKLKKVG
jgi:hypothetical protein